MLYFGNYTEETGAEVNKAFNSSSKSGRIASNENHFSLKNIVFWLNEKNPFNSYNALASSDSSKSNPYNHKGSDGTIYLGDLQNAYDYSLPSSYNNASVNV